MIAGFLSGPRSASAFRSAAPVTPLCLDRGTIDPADYHWLYVPTAASELATAEYYGFLAGQLIRNGVVDASDCPLGGLWPTGYANACGLDKAKEIVFELQNTFDDEILAQVQTVGVPPILLKQLLRYESQFWPVRYGVYHFGMGHLTLIGASTALQWNPVLYGEVCLEVFNGPCPGDYTSTYQSFDNILSGSLLAMMDSTCPECPYGIDIDKAEASIELIAQVLLSYCKQTSQIVYNVTNQYSNYSMDYATIWKLTLLNYNAGPGCVYNALDAVYTPSVEKLDWATISSGVEGDACLAGLQYSNSITARYYSFSP